jgi:DNA adenine methylase
MSLKSPLCRAGRKKPIVPLIVNRSPKNFSIYVESFTGTGDVYFGLNLNPNEVKSYLNDKDPVIYTAFKIIKSNPPLNNISRFVNMSIENIQRFVNQSHQNKIDALAKTIYITCGTFGSKGFGKISKNPNIEPKLRRVPDLAEYMRNTTITNSDWSATFRHDSPNTFFYLDPPYEMADELYPHDTMDYVSFEKALKKLKGKFLLSMNDSKAVRELFKDFKIRSIAVRGGSSNNKGQIGIGSMREVLISNY